LVRHPAAEDGVVQDEVPWEKARLSVQEAALELTTDDDSMVKIEIESISAVSSEVRPVREAERDVVDIAHDSDGEPIHTYIAGNERCCAFLVSMCESDERTAQDSFELAAEDKRVLTALYSGVSPFDLPRFTGMEVDEVEEAFDRLIEREALETIRTRREVSLTSNGRRLASTAMNES
jgi:helix-turn-helix protein